MTFEPSDGKPRSPDTDQASPISRSNDMTNFAKTAGLAGVLVAVFATANPELRAAQPDRAVREGQGVTTELGANAPPITYCVSSSDGSHVVSTVDTVIEHNAEAEPPAM